MWVCIIRPTLFRSEPINLTHATMPLSAGFGFGNPQPLDYRFAIVSDVAGHPDGDVVATFIPAAPGASPANYTYDISGMVQGGSTYWITMESITPASGSYNWYQTTGSLNGHVADRFSIGGVPTGSWSISAGGFGSDQPAFLIQGVAVVPEPSSYGLLGFGLAGLAFKKLFRRSSSRIK
jgi:PEP-CTERM motif